MANGYQRAGATLGAALFGNGREAYNDQLGLEYKLENALQQARQARNERMIGDRMVMQGQVVTPDLIAAYRNGDQDATNQLITAGVLGSKDLNFDVLGDIEGASYNRQSAEKATLGDWNGANAAKMYSAKGPVELAAVQGQNLIRNQYLEGGGGISTTEQGRAGMAADAAQAANSYASAARTRQAAGIDAAQFALQRSGQWNPGGKSDTLGGGGGKALSAPVITQLTKDADKLTTLGGLSASFKDDFGGSPVLGEWENRLGRAGLPLGDKDQAAWWQQYDRHKNVVRNELFGAALTAAEQEAFDKADITPGMSANTITTNLATQERVIRDALARKARVYGAQGYNRDALIEATGLTPEVFDKPLGTPPAEKLPRGPGLPAAPAGGVDDLLGKYGIR